ncbi:MAG: DNA (cytosine-5-)-methyltransferase [Oscillatoria sp. SIO1A7]|nr:DNA (cytosine-5-)-methyltransferase [Oscillatoria sp. SIO1A7]
MPHAQFPIPKPIAVSLFSGAGGMDLGVAQAGFKVLASIEKDPYCCETLRFAAWLDNLETEVIEADVTNIEPQQLMNELSLKAGELDLLFGGPPCQPFSQIGQKKGLEDERGLLLFQILRFAEALQPKFISIEQVKGLLSARGTNGDKGAIFNLLIAELEKIGYVPRWQVVNAANYGVPQLRGRSGTARNLDQYRQIANSVPPPVAKALAVEIYRSLVCQKYLNCSVTP